MAQVHHYMVDYEGKDGQVHFANDVEMFDLAAAKRLAKRQSKLQPCSAAVVAFEDDGSRVLGGPTYRAIGHITYFDGQQSSVEGVIA